MAIKFESEAAMEKFILDEFNKDSSCIIDGIKYEKCLTQVELGAYGRLDMLFIKRDLDEDDNQVNVATVVELKNERHDIRNLEQLSRYMTAVRQSGLFREIKGYLVGIGDICDTNMCFYSNFMSDEDIEVFSFSASRDGIHFSSEHSNFVTLSNGNTEEIRDSIKRAVAKNVN